MTDKELVLEAVSQVPESASLEEIIEHILIAAAIREGQEAVRAGRVFSHEEVKRQVAEWTSRYGRR